MPAARRLLRSHQLLITCEHGGNHVPARYRAAFAGAEGALESHRGYDPGALELARQFARALRAPLIYSTTSRLLIELNRALGHRQSFSPYALRLPARTRVELVRRYYAPYRAAVAGQVARAASRGRRLVHLSCHSFTPRLAGVLRTADVGLLFDPRRGAEARFCTSWQASLRAREPRLRVRRNYPYRGAADGLTTELRRRWPDAAYIGIELEVNQKFPKGDTARWRELRALLIGSFAEALRAA
jgi:predicted N-formylglutamate amidohydrolase